MIEELAGGQPDREAELPEGEAPDRRLMPFARPGIPLESIPGRDQQPGQQSSVLERFLGKGLADSAGHPGSDAPRPRRALAR